MAVRSLVHPEMTSVTMFVPAKVTCYIPATEDAIMDISGNMLVPIESAIPGKMVSQFVPDTVTPELL